MFYILASCRHHTTKNAEDELEISIMVVRKVLINCVEHHGTDNSPSGKPNQSINDILNNN